jgi:hypothetical protein
MRTMGGMRRDSARVGSRARTFTITTSTAVTAAAALFAACGAPSVTADGITDAPIVADALTYLDGEVWMLTDSTGTVSVGAVVPGDLLTDLQRGGVIGDPLYELTWQQQGPLLDERNWTYTTVFATPAGWLAGPATPTVLLVLDGVKMAADIALNGVALGYTANQFLRYSYDVTALLAAGGSGGQPGNTLTIAFRVNDSRNDPEDRFMVSA